MTQFISYKYIYSSSKLFVFLYSLEFVKAIGNTVTKVTLPRGQEASARVIKHVAGTGRTGTKAVFLIF